MIKIHRHIFERHITRGRILVNGSQVGETVEDAVRPLGLKIPKQTAIPEGIYILKPRKSPKWKRTMPMIVTPGEEDTIYNGTDPFRWCYIHPGFHQDHTEGCTCWEGATNKDLDMLLEMVGCAVHIVNDYRGLL